MRTFNDIVDELRQNTEFTGDKLNEKAAILYASEALAKYYVEIIYESDFDGRVLEHLSKVLLETKRKLK